MPTNRLHIKFVLAWVDAEGEEEEGGGDGEGRHAGHLLPLSRPLRLPHMSPLWIIHPHPRLPPLPRLTSITQHSATSSQLKTLHYWTAH